MIIIQKSIHAYKIDKASEMEIYSKIHPSITLDWKFIFSLINMILIVKYTLGTSYVQTNLCSTYIETCTAHLTTTTTQCVKGFARETSTSRHTTSILRYDYYFWTLICHIRLKDYISIPLQPLVRFYGGINGSPYSRVIFSCYFRSHVFHIYVCRTFECK